MEGGHRRDRFWVDAERQLDQADGTAQARGRRAPGGAEDEQQEGFDLFIYFVDGTCLSGQLIDEDEVEDEPRQESPPRLAHGPAGPAEAVDLPEQLADIEEVLIVIVLF